MTTENGDLFGDVELTKEELDRLPPVEVLEAWPKTLRDLMDIFSAKWQRKGYSVGDAESVAFDIVQEFSVYSGGHPLYIPKGKQLTAAFRDREIFQEFGRVKPIDLAKKHKLTLTQIYNIYNKQKALYIGRTQADLFPD